MSDTEDELELNFIWFANEVLGYGETFRNGKTGEGGIYDWQEDTVTPFDDASERMVQVTVVAPNGSGKSAVLIPILALGWLYFYPKGRVVITTADGKQLDGQVMPAIEAHRGRFPSWKFIEREVTNTTGGYIRAFTTDQPGRAEGWHKYNDEEGPLLIIVDEAKTVPEEIFTAIDRCTYNALLLVSSPGPMFGRFYNSHALPELGYERVKVGLLDCPHIGQDKIDRLMAMHGPKSKHPNPELLRSTLHGEFMMAEGETRFDREGLDYLMAMGGGGRLGVLQPSVTGSVIFLPDDNGWLWMDEEPMGGGRSMVFCDPNSCEQGEGTTERDNTACGVLRNGGYFEGQELKDHVVAALHWPGGVKWDSDVLAIRIKLLTDFYGRCMAVVEANNFGSALIKDLQRLGVNVWQRVKVDDINPNKQVKLAGFLSTARTREHWVQKCVTAIREKGLVCRYRPAVNEFQTFILQPNGRAEAQQGFHDDWVAGIGIGLTVRCFSTLPKPRRAPGFNSDYSWREERPVAAGLNQYGACG